MGKTWFTAAIRQMQEQDEGMSERSQQPLDAEPAEQPVAGQLLIIDDEQSILRSLHRQFRRTYAVYSASSAEQGYQLMQDVPIQVIISDQRMPGMSGSEFFEQVKTEFPDAIRLLLTGYADIQSVIAAINDGNVYRYITKPWDPGELDSIVAQAFDRYNLTAQNRHLLAELQSANALLEQRVQERTAALAAANDRLEALNRQKDRFLGMAAHDLRGPLSNIKLAANLVRVAQSDAEREDFTQMIEGAAGNMLTLVNDLLDFAAIESGNLTLRPQWVDVPGLIEKVFRLNQPAGAQKGIALATQLDDDLPQIYCDPARIEQVLNNFISNGFKFSYPDTTVTLQVFNAGGGVEFAVVDQGQGIRPEDLDRLFGEYQRTSARPTGGERSTGLGLSICKRIVGLHGGRIGVESTFGVGSRFYFLLPLEVVTA